MSSLSQHYSLLLVFTHAWDIAGCADVPLPVNQASVANDQIFYQVPVN
jgi:hypothetical protein